ncbi:MAG TPA: hypothetical protein VE130_13235 [Nitrososphaeraceae archaeon]|nr:hypothetical protein [Nitrososphaeraceae archaeon]
MLEKIKYHIMWIWGQEEGFLKRGKEGMLVITNMRIAFVVKTRMKFRVHDEYSLRQLKRFKDGESVFMPIQQYTEIDLENDLAENDKNIDIPFSKIINIGQDKKRWGTVLKVKFAESEETKGYKFMVVKGWVKYPLKDPVSFQQLDWDPVIALIQN